MQDGAPPTPIGDLVSVASLGDRYEPRRLVRDGVGFLVTDHGAVTAFAHSGTPMRFVAYLEFAPGRLRGNHYHRLKTEHLCLVRGSVLARFGLPDGTAPVWETTVSAGEVVVVRPGCVHSFVSEDGAAALEFSPQPFDDADTYRTEVR